MRFRYTFEHVTFVLSGTRKHAVFTFMKLKYIQLEMLHNKYTIYYMLIINEMIFFYIYCILLDKNTFYQNDKCTQNKAVPISKLKVDLKVRHGVLMTYQ